MFTTIEGVQNATGKLTDNPTIAVAQTIIESYVGKTEADVTNPDDRALLANAVAFQAVYIDQFEGTDVLLETAARTTVAGAASVTFRETDTAAPFIAPLAVMTCRWLSWRRSRTVKTGPVFVATYADDWSTT